MTRKTLLLIIILLTLSLMLAGCDSSLSDTEFAESAAGACQVMRQSLDALGPASNVGSAEIYQAAADTMGVLNLTAESAPQGFQLQSGLAELADTQAQFDTALKDALAEAEMDMIQLMFTTEGGDVYASASGSVLDMHKLNIDSALVLALGEQKASIQEAAEGLGLEDCFLVQPEEE